MNAPSTVNSFSFVKFRSNVQYEFAVTCHTSGAVSRYVPFTRRLTQRRTRRRAAAARVLRADVTATSCFAAAAGRARSAGYLSWSDVTLCRWWQSLERSDRATKIFGCWSDGVSRQMTVKVTDWWGGSVIRSGAVVACWLMAASAGQLP